MAHVCGAPVIFRRYVSASLIAQTLTKQLIVLAARFIPGTGRLWYSKDFQNPDTTGVGDGIYGRPASINHYDAAGNLIWTGDAILRLDANGHADAQSERRMYYGPDGKLRAVDARAVYYIGPRNPPADLRGFSHSFEEYRYDALGRRVMTRSEQNCDYSSDYNLYNPACHVSGLRRTIWDGQRELGEIQVPLEQAENDTYAGQGTVTSNSINLAPFYGAVAYLYDGKLDQPLGVTRIRYSNLTTSNTIATLTPFTYYPVWDIHGKIPHEYHPVLPAPECAAGTFGGTKGTCIFFIYQYQWLPYRDASNVWQYAWHGSLLEDKVGAGGLMYRRSRYYDSKTGRFTQEDPIGLAGGLNLYGFAGGDPVNYSDPFGLNPCLAPPVAPACLEAVAVGGAAVIAILLTKAIIDQTVGNSIPLVNNWSTDRMPTGKIRKLWEELWGKKWPTEPSGRPYDADHDIPLADGGTDTPDNVTPRTHDDHVQRHKDKGDFARWGRRGKKQEPKPQEPPQRPQDPQNPQQQFLLL